MNRVIKVLIVEDDMIIAANISLQLSKLGYEVTGIESRGEDAINHNRENHPDMILMDINLKGEINGIETARIIKEDSDVALIYLTANTDDTSFQKAKETNPYAFISKPFNKVNLERTIALVVEKIKDRQNNLSEQNTFVESLEDRIFIRNNGKLIKLMLEDIHYVEADRNYCNIYTAEQQYVLVNTLNTFSEKVMNNCFLRVHRSFIVNLKKLDAVAENHLEINRKIIPVSKMYKDSLLSALKRI
ncbi:MAG: DNA-binding response regulator [Mongoliibacter sp.]|uniref:response regulator n=1 Tax=Mongoliibacter sp. TaxID=2022438 RepID=UPI0012F0FBCE|nr:response regulator [Mongoliibacter sp.]TVP51979.1 MAG: DNA-binding response regulator [Mongoliibacter sp.]